ncbi:cytochrome b5 reductase 4-like [Hibiscus syriacus]|uniref:cytochrome b5 reductase 4-like n=1 Tax=Hibiscus syriacus TaxID=106335 RepID=UPI0019225414|nr:cytochrome b5 reductase 4-like [Hibiscus syriacus]
MGGEGKAYTSADVSQHNNTKDCWLVIGGKVYNVTKFLEDHPGGDEVLLSATGTTDVLFFLPFLYNLMSKLLRKGGNNIGMVYGWQGMMQPMISRMLVIAAVLQQCWMSFTWVTLIHQPSPPRQSTLLRSSLTMIRLRPRNSL